MKIKQSMINIKRLMGRMMQMAEIGAIEGGGVCRLALTDEDKISRDLFSEWMKEQGLEIKVDAIGNMVGLRTGQKNLPPVAIGSHLDTVATGGKYDGSLGVLAGLEVIEILNEQGIQTKHPIALINFTNEEGARFTPDMMGSLALSGAENIDTLLKARDLANPGVILKDELNRIGYHGEPWSKPFQAKAFIELHIEQGPILENEGLQIGAVERLQGIFWTEYVVTGSASHAGTTPMQLRKDAAYVASMVTRFIRNLTKEIGNGQVGTVGLVELLPNAINVVAEQARFTVDLRNPDKGLLEKAQQKLDDYIHKISVEEGTSFVKKELVRFAPVNFDQGIADLIENTAVELGLGCKKMVSGAGHDAQMMASICPTAMIFIPSKNGISHNVNEFSSEEDIEAGANVLLNVVKQLAG
ncbi:Zn-dependent hydrolase [Fulvivirgaceae bacterium BMA10]|uniref:Zn-dependent hydrolase n=1 Tax=Splendidivirga corallicola TaxID=3051826 RepID=A0ABT8KGJ4_9BACT|nr:Zn-dependent hydrolase [Fulvivirgaceae bacterium BMA10]